MEHPSSLTPDPDDDPDLFMPDFAPVPLLRQRRNGWAAERQQLFVALLAETGSVSLSARCVGLSARSAYKLREKPGAGEFDAAWTEALALGTERTRSRLIDRWRNGESVPVRHRGRIVGHRQVYNDRALVAVLVSRRREIDDKEGWRAESARAMRREREEAQRQLAETRKAEAAALRRAEVETAAWLEANRPRPQPRIRML